MTPLKVSIITPVLNGQMSIEATIMSVLGQSYTNIEYIIVDNGSTDSTMNIINKYNTEIDKVLFERTRGIYTTMNRGLKSACGDIIGILNSDDIYIDNTVIENAVSQMTGHNVDSCYGDLQYVDAANPYKVIRHWKSCKYKEGLFKLGWMPPHPTFFVKKEIYNRYGLFNTDYKIAADYEIMMRFLCNHKISTCYIPRILVKMQTGGRSNRSIRNLILKSYEDYKVCKSSGLNGLYTVLLKNISKVPQFFQ